MAPDSHEAPGPSWPSLYNPAREIINIQGGAPVQMGAHYLYNPEGKNTSTSAILEGCSHRSHIDVFRFTFYWTLIFQFPFFFLCGLCAFVNLTFPPSRHLHKSYPLSSVSSESPNNAQPTRLTPPRANMGRTRLMFAVIVMLVFLALSVANAVIGAVVVGYILAGLYKGAKYNMSTCV